MISISQIKTQLHNTPFTALSHPNFRLYFTGQLVSVSGTWMQVVAQGWLVFHLTQSELWLGVVACAAGVPSLLLSPFAGVIVDRLPRRKILIVTQTVQMLLAFILAVLAFTQTVQVWHIVALAFCLGAANMFDAPARQSFIVEMVGREDLPNGIALNSTMVSLARVVGPAAAGLALASWGAGWCFLINGVSFLAVIGSLLAIKVAQPNRAKGQLAPLRQLREGLAFARRHETITPLLLLAAVGSLFVINIMTLLPAFADRALHSPIDGYAALSTAQGGGAVFAGVAFGFLTRRFGRGRVMGTMMLFTCLMMLLVSRVTTTVPAVILMGLAGFGLIFQFVCINTMIQTEVSDELRGRILSLYTLTLFGMAPFGALALGMIAGRIGTPDAMALYAVVSGSLSLVILTRAKKLWRLV